MPYIQDLRRTGTATLKGSEANVVEAASVVVGGSPWPQSWSVNRLRAVCGRLTSVVPKRREEMGKRKVTLVSQRPLWRSVFT